MPIEIRELVIKATVDSQGGQANSAQGETDNGGGQEQLVNLCVEKVMQIIQSKSDR